MKRKILIIDSDRVVQRLLGSVLSSHGFETLPAFSVSAGVSRLAADCPDILFIDVASRGALSALAGLREWASLPVIAMAEAATEALRVESLNSGADIFIEKPLSPAEVLAYARVCVRRICERESAAGAISRGVYKKGDLTVSLEGGTVTKGGQHIHLTANEFKILSLLCRYSGRVLSYDFIMNSVWGPRGRSGNGLLRVNITNIRRKIERDFQNPEILFTENGIGYRLAAGE